MLDHLEQQTIGQTQVESKQRTEYDYLLDGQEHASREIQCNSDEQKGKGIETEEC